MAIYDQSEFDIRFEWGVNGVVALAQVSDVVIIVDVLSFTTSVEIAVTRGATIFPYPAGNAGAAEFARSVRAELAGRRSEAKGFSLSPASLMHIKPGARLVLPSPNGATLAGMAGATPVYAGCFRNARAAAIAAQQVGPRIAVVAAGERWRGDNSLRPSFEDLAGAGAIIVHLPGLLSPEAAAAAAVFQDTAGRLKASLAGCSSGKELIERGFGEDVRLATELDASSTAPHLVNGAFIRDEPG